MKTAYTGGLLESELFGEFESKREGPPEFLDFNNALKVVKAKQPGDPAEPQVKFANDLHASIAERLCPDDYSLLEFYTAIGSQLDWHHGVDGFFEYTDLPTRNRYRITIDLTSNSQKLLPEKEAEYLMYINEEELYGEALNRLISFQADQLTRLFKKKIANREVYP